MFEHPLSSHSKMHMRQPTFIKIFVRPARLSVDNSTLLRPARTMNGDMARDSERDSGQRTTTRGLRGGERGQGGQTAYSGD